MNWLLKPCLTLLLIHSGTSDDENIGTFDLSNPIVINDWKPQGGWNGGLFGWSTGLVNVNTDQGLTSWIFIGNPTANVSRDQTYVAGRIEEPGVVWRCTLFPRGNGGNELRTPDCETLNLDPIQECRNSCPAGVPQNEYHHRSWVGGNIVTAENRLAISAHHWHRGGTDDPLVNGLVYWFDPQRMYTGSKLNIEDNKSHRLIPFYFPGTQGKTQPHQFYLTESRSQYPDLAHGEAGVSLHLTKHGQLLVGAPGVKVWRGAVVRYQDNTRDVKDLPRLNAYGKSEFNGYRILKRNSAVANDYFGYSVTSGKFVRGQFDYFVGGSPRARGLMGQVIIFQLMNTNGEDIDERTVLVGNQFGSYFGSVLASVDVNNDGLDELLIGAPLYDDPTSSNAGSQRFIDHGMVFIYSSALSTSHTISSENLIRISSGTGNIRGGRFGSAMVNLKDINEDGREDFAIGAPYEDAGGAVYVYHGKDKLDADWKPALKITSKLLSLNLRGLGCAFSVPVDVDHNDTPDLAIGALTSQSVLLLRTRPILDFETEVTYYSEGNYVRQIRANEKTFQIKSCVRLKGKALTTTKTKLRLDVSLTMDVGQGSPRFSFLNEPTGNRVSFQLEPDAITFACHNLQAKADVVLNEKSASIDPIYFEQLVQYKGKSRRDSPLVYEIQSNAGKLKVVGGQDEFDPSAPFPLTKRITPEELNINSDCKNPSKCVPNLGLDAWWADDTKPESKTISGVDLDWGKRLGIHVNLWNKGEPAYSPEVTFVFKSTTAPKKIDFQLTLADCQWLSDREGKTRQDYMVIFKCTLKKPLRSDEVVELIVPVMLVDVYANAETDRLVLDISVQARNDSASRRSRENLELELFANIQVNLIGSVTQPSEAVSVYTQFYQQYEVILTGTSPIDNLYFKFRFPQGGEGSEPLLRVRTPRKGIQCSGGYAEFSKDDEKSDMDEAVTGNPLASRRRREVGPSLKTRLPEVERMLPNENMTLLGCGGWEDEASYKRCIDITCSMYKVHPNLQIELIRFDMMLNKNESLKILDNKRYLLLESLGSVDIFKERKPQHHKTSFAQTIVHFNDVSLQDKNSLLYYIVSGIGGFLLLILIIFGLYKLGFFKRAVKQELEERKAEVAEQSRRQSMLENPSHDPQPQQLTE